MATTLFIFRQNIDEKVIQISVYGQSLFDEEVECFSRLATTYFGMITFFGFWEHPEQETSNVCPDTKQEKRHAWN